MNSLSNSQRILANPLSVAEAEPTNSSQTPDVLSALWRYRWAVALPTIVAMLISFLIYSRMPEVFESSSRLLIESNRPTVLDQVSGDVVGGVPSVEIIQSQLLSDTVLNHAFHAPVMEPYRKKSFNEDPSQFAALTHRSLSLVSNPNALPIASARVMVLRFQHEDKELAKAAVDSFSGALQKLFDDRQKASRENLIAFVSRKVDEIQTEKSRLEKDYAKFRKDAQLIWDVNGQAVNPHRERQLFLTNRKSEINEVVGQKKMELAAIESIAKNSKDHEVAIGVIGQLMDVNLDLPNVKLTEQDLREADAELAQLRLDQELVPLMIQRNKYAAQFGEEHPTVRELDSELELMKSELKRIVEQQTERIVELMNEKRSNDLDPQEIAAEAINTLVHATSAEIALLEGKVKLIVEQIEKEKQMATELAQAEQMNHAMLREIEANTKLLDQFIDYMKRTRLTNETGGTRVEVLTRPSNGTRVAPMLAKYLAIGCFLGLGLGFGLAFLLEKNANTFRDPEEVSELLGVPVLSHLPFFKGRTRKVKRGEIDPFEKLDPYLSVVHQPASIAAEAIRSVRTSLMFELAGEGGKIVQVTSPLPGDGKSTIAGNLACSLAQSGKRVLAIDCDLRRPQLTDNFSFSEELGLTNVLNGECEPQDASHQTPLANLRVMPSGPIPSNPAEALTLPEMAELLELLREQYDYVVLDTPPLLVVTDPSITASMVDGVLLALRIRRKSRPNAKEAANILRAVGSRLMGVVINNSDESGSSDGYRGYGYYRYGRYTSRYYRAGGSGNNSNAASKAPMVVSGRGLAKLGRAEEDPSAAYEARLDDVIE